MFIGTYLSILHKQNHFCLCSSKCMTKACFKHESSFPPISTWILKPTPPPLTHTSPHPHLPSATPLLIDSHRSHTPVLTGSITLPFLPQNTSSPHCSSSSKLSKLYQHPSATHSQNWKRGYQCSVFPSLPKPLSPLCPLHFLSPPVCPHPIPDFPSWSPLSIWMSTSAWEPNDHLQDKQRTAINLNLIMWFPQASPP